jgi:hypothetical protein
MRLSRVWAPAILASMLAVSAAAQPLPFQGPRPERFLRDARVVRMKPIGRGITHPSRATLTLGGLTRDAVWKTINRSRSRSGRTNDFGDTYRAECAAYRLDRLLGLGMVPATIQRTLHGHRGSLQLWIAPAMSEAERQRKSLQPPDREAWDPQAFKVRLFDNLIFNPDRNTNNILVTPDWRIRLIDHSRAFRLRVSLREAKGLTRFSRSLLAAIHRLDEATLRRNLGDTITDAQIRAILRRRDLIEARARRLAVLKGAAAVYYP